MLELWHPRLFDPLLIVVEALLIVVEVRKRQTAMWCADPSRGPIPRMGNRASEIYESFYVQLLPEAQSSQPVLVCHVTIPSLCCAILRSHSTRLLEIECQRTFSHHTKT